MELNYAQNVLLVQYYQIAINLALPLVLIHKQPMKIVCQVVVHQVDVQVVIRGIILCHHLVFMFALGFVQSNTLTVKLVHPHNVQHVQARVIIWIHQQHTARKCQVKLTGCQNCYFNANSDLVCNACNVNYYLSSGACVACTTLDSHCVSCLNSSICIECNTSYYLSPTTQACVLCSSSIG